MYFSGGSFTYWIYARAAVRAIGKAVAFAAHPVRSPARDFPSSQLAMALWLFWWYRRNTRLTFPRLNLNRDCEHSHTAIGFEVLSDGPLPGSDVSGAWHAISSATPELSPYSSISPRSAYAEPPRCKLLAMNSKLRRWALRI
jgi:hypothetical protein